MDEFKEDNLRTAFDLGNDRAIVMKMDAYAGTPFLVIPTDKKVEDISKFLPAKREAKHALLTIKSFTDYVKEFGTPELRLFATVGQQPTIRAEFDYLPGATALVGMNTQSPAYDAETRRGGERKHVVTWTPKLSHEWLAWTSIAGKALSQMELAEFLDEWAHCCVTPDAATMLELSQTLEANQTCNVKNAVRVKDGSGAMSYKVDVVASAGTDGNLKVPDRGEIELPLFEGGAKLSLKFRLRIRVTGGAMKVSIHFDRVHDLRRGALAEVIDEVTKVLELPVYIEA